MRRLAAIMFTDMVGYSALSQRDEALALELLTEHRSILRPFFIKHDGREIETAGDSFFVEFNSAVEATNCAIEIQGTLNERNKTELENRRILLRIGIHIGDVVYMDQHVHGDGVNIAARLEPKASPGGICISEDVARQIRNKVAYPITKHGEERLKNISMPMEIYRIDLPWVKEGPKARPARKKKVRLFAVVGLVAMLLIAALIFLKNGEVKASPHTKYRLAVLPLKNISNDPKDEYFSDGMTEELISSISKIGGLSVIARTSIMKYKQTNKDISTISRELMVGTILEGSVRKVANKARITVQLIDAANQENLWSTDYDVELSDIFTIQSEIATSIAKELQVRLVQSEKQQLDKSMTSNSAAYQEYLLGKHYLNQRTSESIQTALTHFETATKTDPQFALPYPYLAYCYTLVGVAGYGAIPKAFAETKAKESVAKALELDSTLAEAHASLGYIKFRFDWDWKGSEQEFKKAIELKPGNSTAHEWYALLLGIIGRNDEALAEMKTALSLDPLAPNVSNGLARIYHFRGEEQKALEQIKKTIQLEPTYGEAHFTAGMTYLNLGDFKKSEEELRKAIELAGRRPVMLAMLSRTLIRMGRIKEAEALLKELESPPPNYDKLYAAATIKNALGQKEEAFDVFEKLIDEKYGIMVYMKAERKVFKDTDDPRYDKLIKKMGL